MPQRTLTGQATDLLQVVLPAAARGDLEAIKCFVRNDPRWVHAVGPHNRTMLWEAARKGRLEVVQFLLDQGADVDAAGCYYSDTYVDIIPYCVATSNGHEAVAALLREAGAICDIYTHAYLGHVDEVAALLGKQPSLLNCDFRSRPRTQPTYQTTPLHYAVAGSHLNVCAMLIAQGAEVKIPGGLLLRWSVWRGHLDIVRLLLQHGAQPASSGITDWATDASYAALAAEFGYAFDIDMPDWLGFPALVDASRGNHNMPDDPTRVMALLDRGARVNVTDHKGKTALHRAAQAGFVHIATVLIERGADIEARDRAGETPLFDALHSARVVTAQLLLRSGASLLATNNRGRSVMDLARAAKRPAIKAMARILRHSEAG